MCTIIIIFIALFSSDLLLYPIDGGSDGGSDGGGCGACGGWALLFLLLH